MEELKNLSEPPEFWKHLYEITKIPRCSENEKKIRRFVKEKAEEYGFNSNRDDIGNLVVYIPSDNGNPSATKIILQVHLDMVCEKNSNIEHDFSKDPIKTKAVEIEGEKWVTADGTTLGADNGVGIAYCLTLMEKISKGDITFKNIAFELLFTVNEELELTGAFGLDGSLLEGKYLINLDSEEDDAFTIGCAGGIRTYGDITIEWEDPSEMLDNIVPLKIKVVGLLGGHSGADIHKPRGNSLKILGIILWKLNQQFDLYLSEIEGGNRPNAIPRESMATIHIKKDKIERAKQFIEERTQEIKDNLGLEEPDLDIIVEKGNVSPSNAVFEKYFTDQLIHLLYILPHGVFSMHPQIEGLVHTSSNFASIQREDEQLKMVNMQRSVSKAGVELSKEIITASFLISGLDVNVHYSDGYPGWEPNFDSKVLKFAKATYEEQFDGEPIVKAIHAGLECGILKEKLPETEMISIGPTIKGPHSPDERLQVKSVEKVWTLLVNILKKFE
ncbi:MAG: Cytosol non-specific dipeptidase [Promethearchaeota archaeon]|nr:MAG: Cytosol non-specific dipeptidase [Candidatus Lokiarchaeota archaeon]